jgi:hypothetical protein
MHLVEHPFRPLALFAPQVTLAELGAHQLALATLCPAKTLRRRLVRLDFWHYVYNLILLFFLFRGQNHQHCTPLPIRLLLNRCHIG